MEFSRAWESKSVSPSEHSEESKRQGCSECGKSRTKHVEAPFMNSLRNRERESSRFTAPLAGMIIRGPFMEAAVYVVNGLLASGE